jgi:hypothetical protein
VDYDPLPSFHIRCELASLFSNSFKRQTAWKSHQKRFMRIQLTRFDFIIFVYWDFSPDETFPLFKSTKYQSAQKYLRTRTSMSQVAQI